MSEIKFIPHDASGKVQTLSRLRALRGEYVDIRGRMHRVSVVTQKRRSGTIRHGATLSVEYPDEKLVKFICWNDEDVAMLDIKEKK